jgi:SAM-dependent methyltransferase
MDFREYEIMYEAEIPHWWYSGLRDILFRRTGLRTPASRRWRILDAGCGTGGTLHALRAHSHAWGFDYSPIALHFCRQRKLRNIAQGSIRAIPFPSNHFDLVISNDVLCDTGAVDDAQGLREIYRVLKPGGRVFLNLPAYPFLRSEHDVAAAVEHRYTRPELRGKLQAAGFRVWRLSHWNTVLFPVVVAVRLARRGGTRLDDSQARSDIRVPAAPINRLVTMIIRLESRLLDYIDLPYGSSVFTVSQKPGSGPPPDAPPPAPTLVDLEVDRGIPAINP